MFDAATTRTGLIAALTPGLLPQSRPVLLSDAKAMKLARGDTDMGDFALCVREFGSRYNATIEGAANAMSQWIAKADKLGWSETRVLRCKVFLADLNAIRDGSFGIARKAVA